MSVLRYSFISFFVNTRAFTRLTFKRLAFILPILLLSVIVSQSLRAEENVRGISLSLDKAKLLKLPEGTQTLVIGNPAIADVTVHNGGVMVLTGKVLGVTNMIALDGRGIIISDTVLKVVQSQTGRILVQRGFEQEYISCAPLCTSNGINNNMAPTASAPASSGLNKAAADLAAVGQRSGLPILQVR